MLLLVLLSACSNNETQMTSVSEKVTLCKEPRPMICTMDYTPVCGRHKNNTVKTYSNGCGACSDPDVVSYVPDACPEE